MSETNPSLVEGVRTRERDSLLRQIERTLTAFLTAIELLTLLRLRRARIMGDASFGVSQAWFPAVGLALGAGMAGLDAVLREPLGAGVTGWLLAGALLLVTGGLHVDGLGDTADGLFGGRTREERLRIMHDGSVGALGAATIFIVLALKATSFAGLDAVRWETLVLAPCLARFGAVVAIAAFPYARPTGLGRSFHDASLPLPAILATTTAVIAALLLLGAPGLVLVALTFVTALSLGAYVSGALGGLTGDVYGAVVEICEVVVLLACLVLVHEGFLA